MGVDLTQLRKGVRVRGKLDCTVLLGRNNVKYITILNIQTYRVTVKKLNIII